MPAASSDNDSDSKNKKDKTKDGLMRRIGAFEEIGMKITDWEVTANDYDNFRSCEEGRRFACLSITLDDGDKNKGKDTGSSKDKSKGKELSEMDKMRIENAKRGIYMNPDKALSNGEPLEERFRGLIMKDSEDDDPDKEDDEPEHEDDEDDSDKKPEIYDISTPKEDVPPIIVISLINTPEGIHRRSQLNMKYVLCTAFHWEDSQPHNLIEIAGRAQESTGTAPRQRATFYSHYMLWKQVAEGSINTIIAEDDAILVRDIDLTILSDDCITLLGGCIRTPGTWNREMAEFVEAMKFLDIVKNFKPGLNNIDYDNFRWTNCLAYYLPVNIARKLVDKVVADKHKVRPVDIWLGQTGFVQQLFFPNMFIDMDEAVTQVNSPKGHQKADFYICEFMRKWAMKQGINLSARGSNTLLAE